MEQKAAFGSHGPLASLLWLNTRDPVDCAMLSISICKYALELYLYIHYTPCTPTSKIHLPFLDAFWGTSWAKWQIKESCHNSSGHGGTSVWRIEAVLQSDSDGTVTWSFNVDSSKPKNTRWWTCVLTVHLDEWFWAAWNHTLLVNLSLRCLRMSFKSVCLYDGTSLAGWPIVAHKKCIPLWGLRPLLQVPSSLSPWSWVQYGQCQVIAKPQMQAG